MLDRSPFGPRRGWEEPRPDRRLEETIKEDVLGQVVIQSGDGELLDEVPPGTVDLDGPPWNAIDVDFAIRTAPGASDAVLSESSGCFRAGVPASGLDALQARVIGRLLVKRRVAMLESLFAVASYWTSLRYQESHNACYPRPMRATLVVGQGLEVQCSMAAILTQQASMASRQLSHWQVDAGFDAELALVQAAIRALVKTEVDARAAEEISLMMDGAWRMIDVVVAKSIRLAVVTGSRAPVAPGS